MVSGQHDVTRRETLAAIGLTGVVGMAPAAAMADGQRGRSASEAAYARSLQEMPSLSDYGTVEQGSDISSALSTAIADATSNNTRLLRISEGIYTVPSTVTVNADDLTIVGHGAVISSTMTANAGLILVNGDDVSIIGLRTELTDAATTAHHYRVNGDNCHVNFCEMEYTAGNVNANSIFVRDADGFQIIGCTKRGSNAFIGSFSGDNALVAFNEIYGWAGGDDFFAIKAFDGPSENIRLIGNHIHGHSAMISIGTQIGALGVDDPTYSFYVRNVVVQGNVGHQCGSLALIKPGSNVASDYRNGLVEDVVISDNILNDVAGVKFATGVELKAGRGAIIRNVKGGNNVIRARAYDTSASGRKIGGLYIHQQGGGATPTIEDIDVGITYIDPHDGAAFGTAGTVKYPVESIARIEPASLTLGDINLRIEGNGCSETGVRILSGGDNKITVEKLKLKNYHTSGVATGGLYTASIIKVPNANNVSISGGTGADYQIDTGGGITGSIGYNLSGTVAQGTSKSTGVTLDYTAGHIAMSAAALAADTSVSFTLTNGRVQANDILVLNHVSGGTAGAYTLNAQCGSGTATITVRNVTAGSLSESIVIAFAAVSTS